MLRFSYGRKQLRGLAGNKKPSQICEGKDQCLDSARCPRRVCVVSHLLGTPTCRLATLVDDLRLRDSAGFRPASPRHSSAYLVMAEVYSRIALSFHLSASVDEAFRGFC